MSSCDLSQNIGDELVMELLEEKILKRVPFIGIPIEEGKVVESPYSKLLLSRQVNYLHLPNKMLTRIDSTCLEEFIPPLSFLEKNKTPFRQHSVELVEFDNPKNIDIEQVLASYEANAILFLTPFCYNKREDTISTHITFFCGKLCGSIDRVSFKTKNGTWEIAEYKNLKIF